MRTDTIFRIYSMTKPLVSVGVMMLLEEGRLLLGEPIGKYLPDLAEMQVAVEGGGTVPAAAPITIQDLLRHTSGLTYEFRGDGPVQQAYAAAGIARRGQSNADQVAMLGRLPLLHQPGTRWEYSRSTDVLGRLIEVVSGQSARRLPAGADLRPARHGRYRLPCPAGAAGAAGRGLRHGPG